MQIFNIAVISGIKLSLLGYNSTLEIKKENAEITYISIHALVKMSLTVSNQMIKNAVNCCVILHIFLEINQV